MLYKRYSNFHFIIIIIESGNFLAILLQNLLTRLIFYDSISIIKSSLRMSETLQVLIFYDSIFKIILKMQVLRRLHYLLVSQWPVLGLMFFPMAFCTIFVAIIYSFATAADLIRALVTICANLSCLIN